MRTARSLRAAVARVLYATFAIGAVATVTAAQSKDHPSVSRAPAAGVAAGEDDRYFAWANVLRTRILEQASWADFGEGECRAGSLRVFGSDSASAINATAPKLIAQLERMIIARGIESPLDTAPVKELLGVIMGWEAGLTRPNWDVLDKQQTREAIAAGLTGAFLNPVTGQCELLAPFDTMRVVLPDGVTADAPQSDEVTVLVRSGESGLNGFRDEFFALTRANPNAVMTYTHVLTLVHWRGYAVVAVNRPAELRGAVLHKKTAGGAAYIFRQVGGEWRLVTITRTWS